MSPLASYLAQFLARDAADLGLHWRERARAAVPRSPEQPPMADAALAARIVGAVAGALHDGGAWQDEVMRAGWELGAAAQGAGYPVDALLTEIELLSAILLYAAERQVDALDTPREVSTTPPTETFGVVRRMHEAASLLSLSATRGFSHGQQAGFRSHLRSLRHDLRNPIGTIQNAAALMRDESLPAEQRSNPRYADMVVRNAQSLEDLITRELGEGVSAPVAPPVLLRDLALAVRRATRAEAERAECRVEVDDLAIEARIPVGGLELTLRSLLSATIGALPLGAVAHITGVPSPDGRQLRVAIVTQPPLADPARVADAARSIAEATGTAVGSDAEGWVWAEIGGEEG